MAGGDNGGNIEVTPDDILILGNTATAEFQKFLERRGYKDRIALVETDWLAAHMNDADLCGFIAYPRNNSAVTDVPAWMIDDVKAKVAASLDGMMREQDWGAAP
jgi:hypothetical protein